MPNLKILPMICICAVAAITLVSVLIFKSRHPIATVNAISVNLHTTPDASLSSRTRMMRNGKWQEVTLPNGTRVRIVQQLENGWDKIAVEAMGDTGQPPTSELIGFVKGTLLTFLADEPATTNSQPTSSAPAGRDNSTSQSGASWLDRVSIATQDLMKEFRNYQKDKAENTANIKTDTGSPLLTVSARWETRSGPFGLQFKSYVINFINTGDIPIEITRLVVNKRGGVKGCDVDLKWELQNYGDSEDYQFGAGQCGGSLIRVDYETDTGSYWSTFTPF